MNASSLRPRHALAVSLVGFALLLACSKQREGARCSPENDDNDCDSGLICIAADKLRGGIDDETPRCCPPEGEAISDERCTPLIGGGGGDNLGGDGGEGGESSTTAGALCSYDSECKDGLVCGPQGMCQAECRENRDCEAPLVCDEGVCVER